MAGVQGRKANVGSEEVHMAAETSVSVAEVTASYNPATGERIGSTPLNTLQDVKEAVARARQAQLGWATTSVSERADLLLKVRAYIVERAQELAATISADNGKTRVDALATEVMPAAMAVTYYTRKAQEFLEDRRLGSGS